MRFGGAGGRYMYILPYKKLLWITGRDRGQAPPLPAICCIFALCCGDDDALVERHAGVWIFG